MDRRNRTLSLPTLLATTVLAFWTVACGDAVDGAPLPADPDPDGATLDLEAQRLLSGSVFSFYVEEVSPDGRFLTEVDWSTGDLALRDLGTGDLIRVTDKGSWSASDDYAEYASFSPDGERIAYTWFKGLRGRSASSRRGYEVRSIGVDGSDMRVHLPTRDDRRYVAVEDWSPDGRTLLLKLSLRDRTTQLGLLDVATDRYQILKSTDWEGPATAHFSPDGEWIAFDLRPEPEEADWDIFLLAVDGSREIPLVTGAGVDHFMGWLPDRSGILFHRELEGSSDFMVQRVGDGQAIGEPESVKEEVWSAHSFGFADDAFYYGMHISNRQVHLVSVDLEAGRALSEPEPVASPTSPGTRFAVWSPDGQSLAYVASNHPGEELIIRSSDGEIFRRHALLMDRVFRLFWTSDGLAVVGTDLEGVTGVFTVPLGGEEPKTLMEAPADMVNESGGATLSPDAATVFFRRLGRMAESGKERLRNLVAYDVASHRERVIGTFGRSGRLMSVSPDGSLVAISARAPDGDANGLWVVPVDEGEPRLIYARRPGTIWGGNHGALPFTADGRYILMGESEPETGPDKVTILKIAVDGSGATPIMDLDYRIRNLAVDPTGTSIAFEAGEVRNEIWRLVGFPTEEGGGAATSSGSAVP